MERFYFNCIDNKYKHVKSKNVSTNFISYKMLRYFEFYRQKFLPLY